MGNIYSKPSNIYSKPSKSCTDEVIKQLNNKYLNYLELDVALTCAKIPDVYGMQNPYLIIISSKCSNEDEIFDTTDTDYPMLCEFLKSDNYSIIHRKTHNDSKKELNVILKKRMTAKFDGVVVLLFCIVRLHDDNDQSTLKFYYDIAQEKRQVDKLKKDLIYRLNDEQKVYIHYYKTTVIARVDNGRIRPAPKNAHFTKRILGIRRQKEKQKNERKNTMNVAYKMDTKEADNEPEILDNSVGTGNFVHIEAVKDHGIKLSAKQNVYITSHFQTNNNPLSPHADTVPKDMEVSYHQFDVVNDNEEKINDVVNDNQNEKAITCQFCKLFDNKTMFFQSNNELKRHLKAVHSNN